MSHRRQRTIEHTATVHGRGLFHGGDVALEFLPAPEFHGIVFQRIDLADRIRIPARIDYVAPRPRRTALTRCGATVEVVEHVVAALAGMGIDNCLVQIDGPECPNGDGSSRVFVEALLQAMVVEQTAIAPRLAVETPFTIRDEAGRAELHVAPFAAGGLRIRYELDAPVDALPPQMLEFDVTPESFVQDIAFARTFVREAEVQALRSAGLGLKTTARDLLVLGGDGQPIDNAFRTPDECVRHKILDCIGDLALAGRELQGEFHAVRTGHRHNHAAVRQIKAALAARRRAA